MKNVPFYDAGKSYEENYAEGPFGIFRDGIAIIPVKNPASLFGYTIDVPFGIPAGPLLNSAFVIGAWKCGFSVNTYKTVRGNEYPCHPFPNVIKLKTETHEIHPGDIVQGDLDMTTIDIEHDGITNSFGVPSKPSEQWVTDAKKAVAAQSPGNLIIMSFMGTKREEMTRGEYIADFARTCGLAKGIEAPVLEVNFSCPNFGKEGLICNDVETSTDILEALHTAKGTIPLLVKIGYFAPEAQGDLERLLDAIHQFADGVVAINTIPARVINSEGKQVLPGSPVRMSSGTCGATIRWGGLEMAERIMRYKNIKAWSDFVVIGVGGVVSPENYFSYMKLGVNAVQSATGAMWRTTLAQEIRQQLS